MNDRIKIICSKCRKSFSERANRLKNSFQVQCPNCMTLITFDSSSEDPNIRRPLKEARDIRYAAESWPGWLPRSRSATRDTDLSDWPFRLHLPPSPRWGYGGQVALRATADRPPRGQWGRPRQSDAAAVYERRR
jgi:DNA-directed RNA polymerase subunit RPC12/RpoP